MKLKTIFSLIATVALTSGIYAGEICYTPKEVVCAPDQNTGYVFAYGGFSFNHQTESSIAFPPFGLNIDTDLDGGYILGGGLGLRSCFLGGTRFEFEGLYNSADMDSISVGIPVLGNLTVPVNGEAHMKAVFINFLKEIPFGCVTGYAGAGIGVATTEWNMTLTGLAPVPVTLEGGDTSLAYQIKIGADVPVTDNLSLFSEYKLIGVGETTSAIALGIPVGINTDDFVTHNLVFGARIGF